MGNSSADNTQKKSFFKNLKSEFSKIIWADKQTVAKQSVAVIIVTAVLAVIIGLVDFGLVRVVNGLLGIG